MSYLRRKSSWVVDYLLLDTSCREFSLLTRDRSLYVIVEPCTMSTLVIQFSSVRRVLLYVSSHFFVSDIPTHLKVHPTSPSTYSSVVSHVGGQGDRLHKGHLT